MRKAEFKNRVEKTKNKHGDLILSVYKASQYRWEETADPQTDDEKYFFTLEEAKEYLETVNMNIGFQGIVDKFEFEYTDFNNEFEFGRIIWRKDYGRKKTFNPTVRSAGSGRFGAIQNSRRGQADPPLCQGTGGRSSPSGTYFDGAAVSSNLLLCKLTAN